MNFRKSFHVEKGVPLFDRQDEMNQFKLFIEKDSRVGLIIYGEEGSGKSRLLEEFSRTLEEKNKTTLMMNIQSSIIIAPFSAIKYVFDKVYYYSYHSHTIDYFTTKFLYKFTLKI